MVWILAICLHKRAQRLERTILKSCKSFVILRLRDEVGGRICVPLLADRTRRDLDVIATTVPMLWPAEIASRKLSLEVIAGEENGVVVEGTKNVVTGGSCRRLWHCYESEVGGGCKSCLRSSNPMKFLSCCACAIAGKV